MDEPRPEKVAVVEEVRARLDAVDASVVTEYRGLTVAELAELRRALAGQAEYKVYKNTLVRRAVAGGNHAAMGELLTGPTAIAFVTGDVSATAKALRDFARSAPQLVVKGGILDGRAVTAAELAALADLPSREVLLGRMAGGIAAPMRQLASLLEALPRNLAYGIAALVDQRREAGEADGPAGEADGPAGEERGTPGGVADGSN